ncbi:hypothetical protein ACQEU3_25110 [Spirillospora sp. CA-253888]
MLVAAMLPAPALAAPSPAVSVTPSVAFRVSNARVTGVSAVAAGVAHPDVWWTLGTVGGKARLLALGRDGLVQAVFGVSGLPAGRHWDALTVVRKGLGSSSLLLGSLAEGRRGGMSLYEVPEPMIVRSRMLVAQEHRLRYPDGGHEAGTLLADPRKKRVYIVTRTAREARIFALPAALGTGVNELTRLRTLRFGVRSAAFAPDGRLFLRTMVDLRVLEGVLSAKAQVLKVPRTGDVLGIEADGRRAVLVDRGPRPAFRAVSLPQAQQRGELEAMSARETAPSWRSRLPGGLLGTGVLGGLITLAAVLGVASLLRERRFAFERAASRPRPRPDQAAPRPRPRPHQAAPPPRPRPHQAAPPPRPRPHRAPPPPRSRQRPPDRRVQGRGRL